MYQWKQQLVPDKINPVVIRNCGWTDGSRTADIPEIYPVQ
jgi:hypothetical protein